MGLNILLCLFRLHDCRLQPSTCVSIMTIIVAYCFMWSCQHRPCLASPFAQVRHSAMTVCAFDSNIIYCIVCQGWPDLQADASRQQQWVAALGPLGGGRSVGPASDCCSFLCTCLLQLEHCSLIYSSSASNSRCCLVCRAMSRSSLVHVVMAEPAAYACRHQQILCNLGPCCIDVLQ